jgi:hypothetical protein
MRSRDVSKMKLKASFDSDIAKLNNIGNVLPVLVIPTNCINGIRSRFVLKISSTMIVNSKQNRYARSRIIG